MAAMGSIAECQEFFVIGAKLQDRFRDRAPARLMAVDVWGVTTSPHRRPVLDTGFGFFFFVLAKE
jgi:hypothetical protein